MEKRCKYNKRQGYFGVYSLKMMIGVDSLKALDDRPLKREDGLLFCMDQCLHVILSFSTGSRSRKECYI